jgi:porin
VQKLSFSCGIFVAAALTLSWPVMADDDAKDAAKDAAKDEKSLVSLSATNITDILGNVDGGLQRGTRVMDKVDLTATFLGDDQGLPGFSVFLDAQMTDGADFSGAVVGAAQTISNLEAPADIRLANAWMSWDAGGQGGVKLGVVDLNTEFDLQSTAALFLNSAFGIGPDFSQSGQNGPSIFPSTGLGLVGWWLPGGHWQLKAGLFEGASGDPTHPGRTNFILSRNEGALIVLEARNHLMENFVIGAGTWRYTASFPALDPTRGHLSGNEGYYAIADGKLYAAPEGEDAGLSGWVRLGWADARINPIATTIAGGLVYAAPFGRKADQVGLSASRAQFGDAVRSQSGRDAAETVLEATYSFIVNSHLTVQPDVQYVIAPGGDAAAHALIMGSRITAAW